MCAVKELPYARGMCSGLSLRGGASMATMNVCAVADAGHIVVQMPMPDAFWYMLE
jgi:hypothetical protein